MEPKIELLKMGEVWSKSGNKTFLNKKKKTETKTIIRQNFANVLGVYIVIV